MGTTVERLPAHKLRTMVGDKLDVQARLHGTERQQGESCLALRHRIIAMWQKQRATELVKQAEPWYLRAMIAPTPNARVNRQLLRGRVLSSFTFSFRLFGRIFSFTFGVLPVKEGKPNVR